VPAKYQIGDWQVEPELNTISRDGQTVHLEPKAMRVLLALIEGQGEVVNKERLFALVWPDTFVTDDVLTRAISDIRRSLEDDPKHPRFIETIPKSGYRLLPSALLPFPCDSNRRTFPQQRKFQRPLIVLSAFFLMGAAALAFYLVTRKQVREPFQQISISRLTDFGNVTSAAISPDGKFLAYVRTDGDMCSLWVKHLRTRSDVQILDPSPGRFIGVTFTPDGDHIFYTRYLPGGNGIGTLLKVNVLGGVPKKVLENIDSPVSFSPDGKQFVFQRNNLAAGETKILIANIDGTGEQTLALRRVPYAFCPLGFLTWSSAGNAVIAFTSQNRPGTPSGFAFVDVPSGRTTVVGAYSLALGQAARFAAGQSGFAATLATGAGGQFHLPGGQYQLMYVRYPEGTTRRITNDLDSYGKRLDSTKDGKNLVAIQTKATSQLWLLPSNYNVQASRPITNTQEVPYEVSWTAIGQLLTIDAASELVLRAGDGTNRQSALANNVLRVAGRCSSTGFSVFSAISPGTGEAKLFRIRPDSATAARLTDGIYDYWVGCSPANKKVFFSSQENGKNYLKTINIDGGAEKKVLESNVSWIAVSPDGKKVAFAFSEDSIAQFGRQRIGVLDAQTERLLFRVEVQPFDRSTTIRFTPDSRSLVLNMTDHGVSNLWLQPIGPGPMKQLTFFNKDEIFDFDFSPDGRSIVLARGNSVSDAVLITDIAP
jgi:Tol biopolymer transport system component